ncbi:uncharacterized protein BDV17DRAFT_270007 [Aspergillus undulatus]|uniref:uncharacterized protein n=1 Tax=Aspergillus undulatus TaxID=1810928 RepID=UPI003CCE0525
MAWYSILPAELERWIVRCFVRYTSLLLPAQPATSTPPRPALTLFLLLLVIPRPRNDPPLVDSPFLRYGAVYLAPGDILSSRCWRAGEGPAAA